MSGYFFHSSHRKITFVVAVGSLLSGMALLSAAPEPVTPKKNASPEEIDQHYLTSIHRTTVEVFVSRPGFGAYRGGGPFFYDVMTAPKPPMSNDKGSFEEEASQPKVDKEKNPGKNKDAHFKFQDWVNKRKKDPSPVDEKEEWVLKKVHLVGLVKNPKPVVYDSDKVPGMKGVKDIPTRELDAFEKKALKALQSGENLTTERAPFSLGDNLIAERKGAGMRAMGPIYAGKQCMACHEKAGEMLGAFTYVFERVPIKKAKTP